MSEPRQTHDSPHSFALVESAPRHGGYVWLEDRLSQIFSQVSLQGGDPSLVRWAGETAGVHRWHSAGWLERLPELREFPVDQLIDNRGHLAETLLRVDDVIVKESDAEESNSDTLADLRSLYLREVLVDLEELYERELDLIGTVDSPMTRRWIHIVLYSIKLQRLEAEKF